MLDDSHKKHGDALADSRCGQSTELQAKIASLKKRYDAILNEPIPERLRDLVDRIRAETADRNSDG